MKKKINSKLLKVSIGIPAFNEEANIELIIKDLLNQKQDNILIERILISSDGSTDRTTEIVKSFKDKKLVLFDNKKRKGLATMQNIIIKNTNSDMLVLLNADIRIKNTNFLEKLVAPISSGKADLTTPSVKEVKPQRFFEKILLTSTKIKNLAYKEFKKGNNVYTCHGQARAFSRKLYKKIHFPSSIGEDAYSYFYCLSNGFKYKYQKDISVLYKLPDNFKDHTKQSIRFFQSQKLISKKFNKNFVLSEYNIPKKIMAKSVLQSLIQYPIYTSFYLFVVLYLCVQSYLSKNVDDKWEIAVSSKNTRINHI